MSRNNGRHLVPEASNGLDELKQEVAREVGVQLNDGYNGDITARDAGKIGGNIVKHLIQQAESQLASRNR